MAYTKPGVEVTQVINNPTTTLITPDLYACVIGKGYWWQNPIWDNSDDALHNSVYGTLYENVELVVALSGINATHYDVADANSVVVTLLGRSGAATGVVSHLTKDTEFSVNTSTNVVTISGSIIAGTSDVKIGYLSNNINSEGFKTLESIADIKSEIGEPVTFNPLAFGTFVAMTNSNVATTTWGISGTQTVVTALPALETKEIYALAPMQNLSSGNITSYKTHCDSMSLAVNKKERTAYVNRVITWTGTPYGTTSSDLTTTAETIRDANAAFAAKRIFSNHPDVGYVLENRPIATIHPTWIQNNFDKSGEAQSAALTSINFVTYGLQAKLANDIKSGGVTYKAGTKITSTIWDTLVGDNTAWGEAESYTVYAPVPGFYQNAMYAGLRVGLNPEQPLTNIAGAGIDQIVGSTDTFSETQLNTIAAGGTFILNQANIVAPITCRHQLSTDMTSAQRRENSITSAVDFVAKFLRDTIDPYIGRSTISPAFLELIETILFGTGRFLKKEGRINDLRVVSIEQDSISPDTLNIEVDILVKYPVNYIRITLQY